MFRFSIFFFFNDTATTEIYTLSLHDALPIYRDPRREDGGEEQRGEDRGEPLPRVDQSHERLVEPAPRVPAQHADDDAGGAAEAHRGYPDGDRRDRAAHDAREHVAPVLVRAERVRRRRALEA